MYYKNNMYELLCMVIGMNNIIDIISLLNTMNYVR